MVKRHSYTVQSDLYHHFLVRPVVWDYFYCFRVFPIMCRYQNKTALFHMAFVVYSFYFLFTFLLRWARKQKKKKIRKKNTKNLFHFKSIESRGCKQTIHFLPVSRSLAAVVYSIRFLCALFYLRLWTIILFKCIHTHTRYVQIYMWRGKTTSDKNIISNNWYKSDRPPVREIARAYTRKITSKRNGGNSNNNNNNNQSNHSSTRKKIVETLIHCIKKKS